jgi:hypothetical protein
MPRPRQHNPHTYRSHSRPERDFSPQRSHDIFSLPPRPLLRHHLDRYLTAAGPAAPAIHLPAEHMPKRDTLMGTRLKSTFPGNGAETDSMDEPLAGLCRIKQRVSGQYNSRL